MKELQNKPAVTIALIAILVGAIVVTALRIKGGTASAQNRTVAGNQQPCAPSRQTSPSEDVPPGRDPFGHAVLYMQPLQQYTQAASPLGTQRPGDSGLPVLPFKIEGMKPANPQMNPPPPGETPRSVVSRPTDEPSGLKLQAVVSGDRPLAVIKDGSGKTHFVHEGDQLGNGTFVVKIINGTVAIRYGGSFSILSLERGSGGNDKTK